jgi:hypothetical protein
MNTVVEISSADGQRRLSVESQFEGLCRFTEWTLTEGDEHEGTYWDVTHESGLYATPAEAEADARKTLPWLRDENSK